MLAIFGGSFDPIHFGHLKNTKQIQNKFNFNQFLLLPCGKPLYKDKLFFSQAQRLEMLKIAIKDYPYLTINTFEHANPSYTFNTLQYFKKKYQKICFIMGSDSFKDLSNWGHYEKFANLTNILILNRGDKIKDFYNFKLSDNKKDFINSVGKIYFVKNNLITISSTAVRSKIQKQKDLTNLLPPKIITYINEQTTITTN